MKTTASYALVFGWPVP